MITVYAAMHIVLGFLLAAFLLLLLQPAYRRRIERFAVERLRRSLPLTETEITAERDKIRAGFAIDVHNLETKLESAILAAARQSVEINRRDAKIQDLEQAILSQKMSVEEHENARRVLEQAILDRLPKVELRLSEARKLLVQRDREIMLLTETGSKQSKALEEATQINSQQRDELDRVKSALETRAVRNRETIGDARFDGEVALRSEVKVLRAKAREQNDVIALLRKAVADVPLAQPVAVDEIERLKSELASAESTILSFSDTADERRAALESQIRALEDAAVEHAADMSKMRAALKAFADSAVDPDTGLAPSGLASRVEVSQLQSEIEDSRRTIEKLRAEISGSNERLVRQAQHFQEELRRLSIGVQSNEGPARVKPAVQRRSLAERIAAPRVPQPSAEDTAASAVEAREARVTAGTFLKAVNGGAMDHPESPAVADTAQSALDDGDGLPRRGRLLDRISSLDKQG